MARFTQGLSYLSLIYPGGKWGTMWDSPPLSLIHPAYVPQNPPFACFWKRGVLGGSWPYRRSARFARREAHFTLVQEVLHFLPNGQKKKIFKN